MYYVYDSDEGILITQEEWEEVVRREEIDFSDHDFERYLTDKFTIPYLFEMTDAEKEVIKNDYVHDYIEQYDFDCSDRWIKIDEISMGVEEQISGQYIQHIKAQMKS